MQAYLEFFASPEFVEVLLDVLQQYPLINYHVVSKEVSFSLCSWLQFDANCLMPTVVITRELIMS